MKVKDLMGKLGQCPPEMEVRIDQVIDSECNSVLREENYIYISSSHNENVEGLI